MKVISKFFIVSALMSVSVAAAYSQQDCNSYLKQATELVSQQKYCEAKKYYQMYKNCDADADVSTEIAMCERRCGIQTMEGDASAVPSNQANRQNVQNNAADIITLKNGDDIQTLVQEIDDVNVKYKKFDNPSGPSYTLKKSEIFMITYANGNKDVFTASATSKHVSTGTTSGNRTERDKSTSDRMMSENRTAKQVQSDNVHDFNTNSRLKLGAKAGLNLTNIYEKYDGKKPSGDDKGKIKLGIQIGVVGDYALSDALSLQPGVLFYSAGYVNKENDGGDKYKETYTLNYIQIPINFQYKLDMGGINAFVQAGPYLGCAISGKYKWKITEDGNSRSGNESLKFGFDKEEDDYKPFDFGLGLGVGLQFNNIQIGLGYNIGLANMSLYDKSSVKNNGIVLTVSYFFGK